MDMSPASFNSLGATATLDLKRAILPHDPDHCVLYSDWETVKNTITQDISDEELRDTMVKFSRFNSDDLWLKALWGGAEVLKESVGQLTYSDIELIQQLYHRLISLAQNSHLPAEKREWQLEGLHQVMLRVLIYLPVAREVKDPIVAIVDMQSADGHARESDLRLWNPNQGWLDETAENLNRIREQQPIAYFLRLLDRDLENLNFSFPERIEVILKFYRWMMQDDRPEAATIVSEILPKELIDDYSEGYFPQEMDKVGEFWDTTDEKKEAIQARFNRLLRQRPDKMERLEAFLKEVEGD